MPSKRESILAALHARLQTLAAPVLRGDVLPERIPATGLIILRDGKPGEPEVTLSPVTYFYEHRAELEVVIRPTLADGSAESLIRAVNLIPGAGEFVYATETITRSSGGTTVPENQSSTLSKADLPASLDNLEQVAPNLESVSLVVSWFGTDLRAGSCLIQPGVETTTKSTSPKSWAVNGVTRSSAHLISQASWTCTGSVLVRCSC
jgi:hypothetical protein